MDPSDLTYLVNYNVCFVTLAQGSAQNNKERGLDFILIDLSLGLVQVSKSKSKGEVPALMKGVYHLRTIPTTIRTIRVSPRNCRIYGYHPGLIINIITNLADSGINLGWT